MHVDTATVKRIFTRHMLISRKKGGFSLGNMISNTVYNHYLTAYAPKNITRFDTHKKSELESVYKSILKINKESPWYLDVTQKETQEYAVNIKENARLLYNTIASMGGLEPERTLKRTPPILPIPMRWMLPLSAMLPTVLPRPP